MIENKETHLLHENESNLDLVLASNMISVGIDVARWNVMLMSGQPRSNSEYIQSSSRVARNHMGLVVNIYSPQRIRECSMWNFCHGRFIFLSKHLGDSALLLFLTPQEQQFAKDLILESISWRDKKDIFPRNTPVIKIETEMTSPLASIDLLMKMYVLFDEIAKANDEEPCSPKNPCGIDKRFPRNTPFKGL